MQQDATTTTEIKATSKKKKRGNPKGNVANLKPFKKGQSGCPGGKSKVQRELTALAKEQSPKAFHRIVELVDNDDPRVAFSASKEILDRAWGKAQQKVDVDHKLSFGEEFEAFLSALNEHRKMKTIDAVAG